MTDVSISNRSRYQHGLLMVLILLGISMGLWQETIAPTLPNLRAKLNVSYTSIGYAMSMRSVGNLVALPLTAMAYDSFPSMVPYIMFLQCLIAGIATIIIPWCSYYWVVVLLFIIQSGSQMSMNNGGQLTILQTFKERSIGKMQLYHLGYGIGGVLSGLVSSQFLEKRITNKLKLTKYCAQSLSPNISVVVNGTRNENENKTGFEYIFLIAGTFAICSSLIFLSYTFVRNPDHGLKKVKKKESWLQKLNLKYIAEGKILFGFVMTTSLFFYYFFYIFAVVSFTSYIVVFAIDPCKSYVMSQNTAAYLYTAMNAFFLLGRILGSFILDYHPIITILSLNVLNLFFNFVLLSLSHKYSLALWIGACGMRLCNSIVYPSGTSFMNRYIVVTSSLISLAFLGTTVGAFAGSSIGGYLLDNYPSRYITYSSCIGMSLLMGTTLLITILGQRHGMRNFSEDQAIHDRKSVELK